MGAGLDSADLRPVRHDEDRDVPEPWETSFENKSVVIGLGNRYMRDDGVGIEAARALRAQNLGGEVFVYEENGIELSLLWQFRGAKKIVVIDALRSGLPPGTVTRHVIVPGSGEISELRSLHELELYDIFDLATHAELMPCPVVILGVEPKDCSLGEGLTGEVADAVPKVVGEALRELVSRSEAR
jgi:hydrogenase maturation protease